jgi:hypothetical protein
MLFIKAFSNWLKTSSLLIEENCCNLDSLIKSTADSSLIMLLKAI